MKKNATEFILEHLEDSKAILDALNAFETDLLQSLQAAIRSAPNTWIGEGVSVRADPGAIDADGLAWAAPETWEIVEDGEPCHLLYLCAWTDDDGNSVWPLLGLPTAGAQGWKIGVCIEELVARWEDGDWKTMVKKRLEPVLEPLGFRFVGGKHSACFCRDLVLKRDAVLTGLRDGDWDEALEPIRAGWADILSQRQLLDELAASVRPR
jgi:hypothetical protein